MAKIVELPQNAWFKPGLVPFKLPDGWQVTVHNIPGHAKPALSAEQIKAAIARPLGMPPLREFARGRKEAVIIFDDLTRCTVPGQIAPFILEELAAAGIDDEHIRFIAAVGNHHALTRVDMVKKLGEDIVARFPVYNHCPFLNCKDIGTTSFGTRASVNAEVMFCDLKIAIGQIVPHPIYGLSGGGKMIMPGVSSYESVREHHGPNHQAWRQQRRAQGRPASDVIDGNPFRDDALEIAEMAGLDLIVNTMANGMGEACAILAGALKPTYAAGVKEAKAHYLVPNTCDSDIVIANDFIKASEFMVPLAAASRAIRPEGGSVVVVDNSPDGQVVHYLYDNFGTSIAGDGFNKIIIAPNVKNAIIYNEHPEGRLRGRFANPDQVLLTSDWDKAIATLEKTYGKTARVAVYPNADTQYFAE